MNDYFNNEYSSTSNAKGLPSPVDTPYEPSNYIRSKRSSRATLNSSREASSSPPPLPSDGVLDTATEQSHHKHHRENGNLRSPPVDPRRFTPTLHASLVSEILNLRRELDSKNVLVESLETTLLETKNESDDFAQKLSSTERELRKAKNAITQIEQGTLEAIEGLAQDRDAIRSANDDLRIKLERLEKKVKQQDEDAARTQSIWENEKEAGENEKRGLERRLHVTESRLRAFVEEMTVQQQQNQIHDEGGLSHTVSIEEPGADNGFKDSALGESDTASVHSTATPVKHYQRNSSSLSMRSRNPHGSLSYRNLDTPEPIRLPGNSLADELDFDQEDEYDYEEEYGVGEDDTGRAQSPQRPLESRQSMQSERLQRALESRQSLRATERFGTPKRASIASNRQSRLGSPIRSPTKKVPSDSEHDHTFISSAHSFHAPPAEPVRRVAYVDRGYQPSPPPSPQLAPRVEVSHHDLQEVPASLESSVDRTPAGEIVPVEPSSPDKRASVLTTDGVPHILIPSPMSPPETPIAADALWTNDAVAQVPNQTYTSTSTQTDSSEPVAIPKDAKAHRASLSPPQFVPSIAIHPPSSRPSSPLPYALPPGTKNAGCQTELKWPSRDAEMQTEPIRVDRRMHKLASLLPSPTLPEPVAKKQRISAVPLPSIVTKMPQSPALSQASPRLVHSPDDLASSPEETRAPVVKEVRTSSLRGLALKELPLPRPILSPPPRVESAISGPLNRSLQYGVKPNTKRSNQSLTDDYISDWSDHSDYDEPVIDFDSKGLTAGLPTPMRATPGRNGVPEMPKTVPEHREISPDSRPQTAGSYDAAPAPAVSSARSNTKSQKRVFGKGKEPRSRSPSFGSAVSESYSTQSVPAVPPYPIPQRSSSKALSKTGLPDGGESPTPGVRSTSRFPGTSSQASSLRKVQSATAIRNRAVGSRISPTKARRRRLRSPDLTPVQSMAFDSPPIAETDFPIPNLPSPLQQRNAAIVTELDHALAKQAEYNDYMGASASLKNDWTRPPQTGTTVASATTTIPDETNLVDAIAATMVGEWMWKYIRKRKSFGIGNNNNGGGEDISASNSAADIASAASSSAVGDNSKDSFKNLQAHGTRHKRWVWLSPYERTIMWDTKQPTSGTALLGKKGRKLLIQSVLDVQDPTPLPKQPELKTAFARSILILTPERALKFTAVDEERHLLWMTALTFLAQNNQSTTRIPQAPSRLPPPPPIESSPAQRQQSPSFGRSSVRDSIRLAKGRRPESLHPAPNASNGTEISLSELASLNDGAAEFPSIPRLYVGTSKHQRKRSNTLGTQRLDKPLNSIRSFSSSQAPPSAASNSSSHKNAIAAVLASSSVLNSPEQPNFFEAVGTVRMEAFVDPAFRDGVQYVPAPPMSSMGDSSAPPPPGIPQHPGQRRRGDSNLSQSTIDRRRAGFVFDDQGRDPFKGF